MRPAKTQISLGIRPVWSVFAVRMKKAWVLSYPLSAQRRLWSDWADAGRSLTLLVLSRGGSYNIAERSARESEQCCINHYCSWTDSIKPSLVYPYDFLAFKGSHFQKTYLLFYIENFKILPLNYSSPYARVMDGQMDEMMENWTHNNVKLC